MIYVLHLIETMFQLCFNYVSTKFFFFFSEKVEAGEDPSVALGNREDSGE